ncbi:MAG TPA: hypothetical protein DHV57_06250, partial [Hyphomonas sp.]|nr:hypothetical protein [Hyphomonas sp.]
MQNGDAAITIAAAVIMMAAIAVETGDTGTMVDATMGTAVTIIVAIEAIIMATIIEAITIAATMPRAATTAPRRAMSIARPRVRIAIMHRPVTIMCATAGLM